MRGGDDEGDGLLGPHEGWELELMLAGEKPVAVFFDAREFLPPIRDAFAPHVAAGRPIGHEESTDLTDGTRLMLLAFAFPRRHRELRRLPALRDPRSAECRALPYHEARDREIGRLLGYTGGG